jgi:ribosomal protein L6P/L9E
MVKHGSWFTLFFKLHGTGYTICLDTNLQQLHFQYGFSHLVCYTIPATCLISIIGKKQRILRISSQNQQILKKFSAQLRFSTKRDPYHGKGLLYVREKVKLKTGKKKFS